jgi:hypothetical protein
VDECWASRLAACAVCAERSVERFNLYPFSIKQLISTVEVLEAKHAHAHLLDKNSRESRRVRRAWVARRSRVPPTQKHARSATSNTHTRQHIVFLVARSLSVHTEWKKRGSRFNVEKTHTADAIQRPPPIQIHQSRHNRGGHYARPTHEYAPAIRRSKCIYV